MKDSHVSSSLHPCCHLEDSFSLSSSSLLSPPSALLHVLHSPPLVMLSAAKLPCITCLLLSATRTSLVIPRPPPFCCVVHHPACLVLSITPPPCVIQHPLAPQLVYLDLIVAFIIYVESTFFFLKTQQIVNVVVRTMTITSMWTRQSSHSPTNLFINMFGMVTVNSLQWFMCVEDI